jgi:uncharacterized repeat protein (TIGR01451 family)
MGLSFLMLGVPLITGSLNLAQNVSIDSRVKSDIAKRHYCALAVEEYLGYLLLDNTRWTSWWTANQDPADTTGATAKETITPCGKQITVTVTQQPNLPSDSLTNPFGDPFGTIPLLSSYNDRKLQTTKTVSPTNPSIGQVVTYTITVTNQDSTQTTLTKIDEVLPEDFSYECAGMPDQLTLPGAAPQDISPSGTGCPDDEEFSWNIPPGTSLESGESATLTFYAVAGDEAGTFCNEAYATPGGSSTSSGKTAIVQIGPIPGECEDEAVIVTKTVDSVSLISTDSSTTPFIYTFDVDYTLRVENIGDEELELAGIIDLLPTGFNFDSINPSGDITEVPSQIHTVVQVNRERVTWNFSGDVGIDEGTSKTLSFSAIAVITQGNYWSDVLFDFAGGDFPEDVYTWPTALISVIDAFDVQAVDDEGNETVINLQVWVGDQNGVINTWNLP